ncbi:hypothetical protein LTS16_001114 [Friedmanniomyces endolithicus]|uniref:Uncharacterized protein n=1 Tax=Friedmanniomyces endolithicus TaxID=329885 RepID=A0AAN6FMB8_9PEZI|nr:hypothetical protein LTR35_012583 [Friedmanniomyces endolithicus]KAK0283891.1 hypothetical protein LTS00_011555 [Friedmanniomyces endolithicus]KAK0320396.1 hypothetical protein LTR82_008510 [Friedmanniomyces endolithicus]KAK0929772.1 hypothetical protein LTR57_001628 [Friedmanniomyces endolithicus]KAK0990380.1 hypothetical protein LTR54_012132 [Friedmanniomyces endolithicus]
MLIKAVHNLQFIIDRTSLFGGAGLRLFGTCDPPLNNAMASSPTSARNEGFRRPQRTGTMSGIVDTVQNAAADLLRKDPPLGFFAATAGTASQAPTMGEIRSGSFGTTGWSGEEQLQRRWTTLSQDSSGQYRSPGETEVGRDEEGGRVLLESHGLSEEPSDIHDAGQRHEELAPSTPIRPYRKEEEESRIEPAVSHDTLIRTGQERIAPLSGASRVYSSGYIPPPVLPWTTSTVIALKAFSRWVCTPFGFLLTLYGLNVVAWGGMLFLLLCNASGPMCWAPIPTADNQAQVSPAAGLALNSHYPRYKNCNDINSPRRIWLEITSQILNALFCVTGFGLIPWRFRDFYYLLLWRFTSEKKAGREKKLYGLRVLAGIYRNWARLPDSHTLDEISSAEYHRSLPNGAKTSSSSPSSTGTGDLETGSSTPDDDLRLPLPFAKAPDPPLTGIRAPPTALWKIEFFVWSQVINTFLQVVLCVFMWGFSRYTRPSWSTGLFIAGACIIAGLGGFVTYKEGKKVKLVEGVQGKNLTAGGGEDGLVLQETRTSGTGYESSPGKRSRAS